MIAHHRKQAVFLDRDGTIIEDVGYADNLDQIVIYPWAVDALGKLKDAGFRLILVSNQAGVAKGLIDPAFPEEAFRYLREKLIWQGAPLLDGGYHCPHHPDGTIESYRLACNCRKPDPGMILQAARDFDISLSDSYMVGDHLSDVEAGHRVGAKAVLLLTGHGTRLSATAATSPAIRQPDFIAKDLLEAACWILAREQKSEA